MSTNSAVSLLGVLTIFILAIELVSCRSSSSLSAEKKILDTILSPDKYDPSIRPAGINDSGPVVVRVNVYIRSINDINEMKMEYSTQLTFRQEWIDPRLKYEDNGLGFVILSRREKIWTPDLFFSNEKSGNFHNLIAPNYLIRIFPDGRILYSVRISLKLSCPMDLKNFPLDNQACSIIMASYGYTTRDVIFLWKFGDPNTDAQMIKKFSTYPKTENNAEVTTSRKYGHPVQVSKNLHLEKFSLVAFFTEYCTSNTNTGEYSCIRLDLLFKREFHYYFIQTYVPTTFLIILSWFTLWLHHKSITIRWVICVSVLLTMFFKASIVNSSIPMTAYTKAIDVWTGVCLTFVFAVFIELCFVNNAVMGEKKDRSQNLLDIEETKTEKHAMCLEDSEKPNKLPNFNFIALRWLNKFSTKAQRIDAASRILFPVAFAFFNLIYWLSYIA